MKKIGIMLGLAILLILTGVGEAQAQEEPTIEWLKQFGTSENDRDGGIAVDSAGNVYMVGETSGTFPNQTYFGGGADMFIAKYNSAGNQVWVRQFGTSGTDDGITEDSMGIAIDSFGNIYVTGNTDWSANIAKYDSEGNQKWFKLIYNGTWRGDEIAVAESSGEVFIYVTGYGSFGFGLCDAFIAKFDSNGNQIWLKGFGTGDYEWGMGIVTDPQGNVYVTGGTYGALPNCNCTNQGNLDLFIVKYDSNGNQIWVKQFGTSGWEVGYEAAIDSLGYIYVVSLTGYWDAPNGYDYLLLKYHNNGDLIWTKQFGTSAQDFAEGIAIDSSGSIVVSGYQQSGSDYTQRDMFVAKYNSSSGEQVWFKQIGTSGCDFTQGGSIATDLSGNIYIAGSTNGIFPGQSYAGGWFDVFIAKLSTETFEILPPVANANGPYTGNEGSPITFDGSGSYDPDGTIVKYEWDLDGDGQYDDATGVNPSYTWGDDYSGGIGLKVTDNDGLTDTDSTTVTVNNVPPIASATNDGPKNEGTPVTVTASQVDPGADTFTYSFDWNNDGIYEIVDQAGPSAQYTFMDDGVYTVGVRVKDDDGGIGIATTDVTILDLAPTAEFTFAPEPQNEGSPVQFTDQLTSWPDSIVSWSWNFGDTGASNEQNPAHAYGDNGVYTVSLTITDDDGSQDTVSHNVTILNVAPTVEAGPDQLVNEGDVVSFSGSFTDPGWLDTHTYTWDFGDGGTTSGTLTPTHTYCDNGIYTVTLTVTDDDGGVDMDTLTVTVNNVPPTVNAGPDQEVFAGDTVQFNDSFTDPGTCDSHTISWDFGDGNTASGTLNPSHVYYDAGTYTVTLIVTDDDGGVGSDTLEIVVKPTLAIIPATIDCDPDTLNLKSQGQWITCYIELPEGYDVWKLDGSTVLLNGINGIVPVYLGKEGWAKAESNNSNIMDHDGDGILERMVKFDTAAIQGILSPGEVVLTLTGKVGLADFEGSDTIRVINPGKK